MFHRHLLLAAATLVAASSASANIATKTGTVGSTDLTAASTTAWSGGSGTNGSPTSADVATWDSTSLGGALTAATAVNWGSINITGATANIAITGAGQITTGNISLAGNRTLTIGNTIALSGNSIYDIANVTGTTATDTTLNGAISGAFSLTKSGDGTLTLAALNSYSGGTIVDAGILAISAGGPTGGIRGALTINSGAEVQLAGSSGWSLGYNAGVSVTSITINGGTLNKVDTAGGGSNASTINMTGGLIKGSELDLLTGSGGLAFNTSASADTATVSAAIRLRAANSMTTFTVADGAAATDLLISGNMGVYLSGTQNITKTGAGTMVLSGANAFNGTTTISAGTLLVNNTTGSGLGAGAVSVGAAGRLGGTGSFTGAVTVNGTIRGGAGAVGETLSVGNITLASGSIIELALGAGGTHSTLAFNGTESFQANQVFSFLDMGITAGNYDNLITGVTVNPNTTGTWTITNAGYVGTFSWDGGNIDLNLTAVPEPSTYGLIGAGALAAVAFVRRRRKLAGKAA